jgi:hypothetical protein
MTRYTLICVLHEYRSLHVSENGEAVDNEMILSENGAASQGN